MFHMGSTVKCSSKAFKSGESQKWNVNAYQVVKEKKKWKKKMHQQSWMKRQQSWDNTIQCNPMPAQPYQSSQKNNRDKDRDFLCNPSNSVVDTNRFHIAIMIIYLLIHDLNLIFSLLCYFISFSILSSDLSLTKVRLKKVYLPKITFFYDSSNLA